MNKTEFALTMSKKLNISFKVADNLLDIILETITEELIKGEKIKFIDFGSFEVVQRAARKGYNPYTKKEVPIPACNEPIFKAGKALKEAINI